MSGAIHQLDVPDPTAPRWVSTLNASRTTIRALAVGPEHLYLDTANVLDILARRGVQTAPALAGSVNVPGGVASNVAASARVAYAPVESRGLWMIDGGHQGLYRHPVGRP